MCCVGGLCVLVESVVECNLIGGEFHPDVANCDDIDCCIDQTGACCTSSQCTELGPASCSAVNGIFQGIGTTCQDPDVDCCIDESANFYGACCCEYNRACENDTIKSTCDTY